MGQSWRFSQRRTLHMTLRVTKVDATRDARRVVVALGRFGATSRQR
jgi:hypothetical protein